MATKKDILNFLNDYNDDDQFVYGIWDEDCFITLAIYNIPKIELLSSSIGSESYQVFKAKFKATYPEFINDVMTRLSDCDILDYDAIDEAIDVVWENKYAN